MWPFKRKAQEIETRSSGTGYTAEIMAARESYLGGRGGVADLTATVQSCISLWENGLVQAEVKGADLLTRRTMGIIGRALATRGEAVLLIGDYGLQTCSDWDLSTRGGVPYAYRVSVAEAGRGRSQTALAGEVLHFRIGSDAVAPWAGTAPLRRARLTAGLLQAVETALAEVFDTAPFGSQIVPYPEAPDTDTEALGRAFRGARGRVLLRESVQVSAAGGPAPQSDWKPHSLTPNLAESMALETMAAARDAICGVFGVLPSMAAPAATGPVVREGQRHLAQWTLQPIAELIAEEASAKFGQVVKIDTETPLQAFDAGGRARAMAGVIEALAMAKEAGIDPAGALKIVDWGQIE